jgi:DNA mismatch repair protein MSH6
MSMQTSLFRFFGKKAGGSPASRPKPEKTGPASTSPSVQPAAGPTNGTSLLQSSPKNLSLSLPLLSGSTHTHIRIHTYSLPSPSLSLLIPSSFQYSDPVKSIESNTTAKRKRLNSSQSSSTAASSHSPSPSRSHSSLSPAANVPAPTVSKRRRLRRVADETKQSRTTATSQRKKKQASVSLDSDEEAEWNPDGSSEDDDMDEDPDSEFDAGELESDPDDYDMGDDDDYTTPKKRRNTTKKTTPSSSSRKPTSTPDKNTHNSVNSLAAFQRGSPAGAGAAATPVSRPRPQSSAAAKRFTPSKPKKVNSDGLDSHGHRIPTWLRPENRKDINGKRPGDPAFDPRTLHVPSSALCKLPPGQQQYWNIKKKCMDVILAFKMGKFYELFEDDADVSHEVLELKYMNGQRRHTGFPEAAFEKYAKILVEKGYKVARVEQMERPEDMKKTKGGKKPKVVNRQVCAVLTPGTLTSPDMIDRRDASYLMSFCEDTERGHFGLCYIDTSTGTFFLGELRDDRTRSQFRTVLAQLRPIEVVYPRDSLSEVTKNVLSKQLPHTVIRNALRADTEFWDANTTIQNLESTKAYFPASQDYKEGEWPEALARTRQQSALAMSAFGGCLWYLNRNLLDTELVSMRKFSLFHSSAAGSSSSSQVIASSSPGTDVSMTQEIGPKYAVLDGQTLSNLEILENQQGTKEGTLLAFVDHCSTAFGSRLMRVWVSRPLARISDLNERLEAVEDLMQHQDLLSNMRHAMSKLPDLERLLSRIHAHSIARNQSAVMYTSPNKKKLEAFLSLLSGFQSITKIVNMCAGSEVEFKSKLVRSLVTVGARMPDISQELMRFNSAFDKNVARREGFIIPAPGFDTEFDQYDSQVRSLEAQLKQVLQGVIRKYGNSRKIKYVHRGKETYTIEIPKSEVSRYGEPSHFQFTSDTKTVKRYSTQETRRLAPQLAKAETLREDALRDIMRRMFAKFCSYGAKWNDTVQCLAELDCLMSLAITSANCSRAVCRPEFVAPQADGDSIIELRQASHPALMNSGDSFIPNDTVIGCEENKSRFVLVSGPNMGGKSTLLRQTCVNVVLAQIGCYVPAERCRLTPVDRIFTRVGANDRIMQGQSTFLVELEETANILANATDRSLVILDELGRGTSTFDGTAIAYAVIKYLSQYINCLSLFSTHYHMLMEEFANDSRISMYHMSCLVDQAKESVTFLYQFVPGVCPKSYGMNIARLAGLPEPVVHRAKFMSEQFETRLREAHGAADTDVAMIVAESQNSKTPSKLSDDLIQELFDQINLATKEGNSYVLAKLQCTIRGFLARGLI